mmetsp:Transcript_14980/g.25494  ORF Transcript_14980/g.25494 Transcript_14980/m.25494 type:complete len:238 (+) Transcript_14980:2-715(+)
MEKKQLSKPIGDQNYIQKKVPVAKKYENVQSRLNTGPSSKQVNLVSDQLLAKRKGEKHKRIKCSTLARLMNESTYEESIYNLNDNGQSQMGSEVMSRGGQGPREESIQGLLQMGHNNVPNSDTKSQVSQYSQQSNVTAVSAVTYATDQLGITDQTSFLLLDLRDPDEYDFWRIKESINFPAAKIAQDKMIPELYRFKNKADKLIIVYMNDERKGCQAANMLAEKGYENVFLLSGGID